MTTFVKLTSPTTQAAAPFTTAFAFKRGDVPSSFVLDLTNYQVVIKRRWNDGSVKHAVVSGRAPLTANTPLTVTASPGTPPTGTNMTSANIATAAPAASIQCGAIGTVTLASLLGAAPFRTWVSGPEMVECHYRANVGSSLLSAWFFVRLYAGGAIYVRAFVENGYADNGAGAVDPYADLTYVPTFTIGGTVVYNNGGAALKHISHGAVMAEGWIGADPQVTPQHDVAYLRASKLVPNYATSNPNAATLNSLIQTYTPMAQGAIPFAMPTSGANPSIALLPSWNGNYLGSGDARALRAVLASSSSMRSFPICWRNFTTKDIIKPTQFPTWSRYGPGEGGDRGANGSNGTQWEINHHPGEGYLAYLITGDYWHYETMLLQASFMWLVRGSTAYLPDGGALTRNGVTRLVIQETRGTAWGLRSMAQTCALAPDADLGAGGTAYEYRQVLANNYAYWRSISQQPGINHLGIVYEYAASGMLNGYGNGWNPPWQQFWWESVNGFASDIEPLADMTDLVAVRDFMYQGIVGMLGAYGTGFPYAQASVYNTKISNGTSLNPTTFIDNWHDVAVGTFEHISGGYAGLTDPLALQNGGDMSAGDPVPAIGGSGDPSDASFGRWGYLLPAIAYAVEQGATGAATAWARITNASNYSTLANAGFDQQPQWGVFPRSIGVSTGEPPVTTPGPSFIWDSAPLIPNSFVWGPVRGLGLPLSAIASGGSDGSTPLYDAILAAGGTVNAASEVRWNAGAAAHGTIATDPTNGAILYSGDGTYDTVLFDYWLDGPSLQTAVPINFGTASSTVSGVVVSPSTATGATTFTAVVNGTGSPSQAVTWSRSGSAGSINASTGAFTPPAATSSVQTITITATSTQDGTKSGTATVTIAAIGSITSVVVSPATAVGSTTFSAVVNGGGSPSQAVTWSRSGSAGSINATTGAWVAPAATSAQQVITITATSVQDGTKSGTATVTIAAAPASTVSDVVVSPASGTLAAGGSRNFTAIVNGANSPSQLVTWATNLGTINPATGQLVAPAATNVAQTGTVTATSTQDSSKSGTATFTIAAAVTPTNPSVIVTTVNVTPNGGTLTGNATRQYSAAVVGNNGPTQGVTWAADIGSIDASGLYTPPAATYLTRLATVTATSVFDPAKKGIASVTIAALTTPIVVADNNLLRLDADGYVANTGPDTFIERGREFWIDKDPDAKIAYGIDLTDYLTRAGQNITLVSATAKVDGVTPISDVRLQGNTIVVQLADGKAQLKDLDNVNRCTFHFTLSNGDENERSISFAIVDN